MEFPMLFAKIHRATVTDACLDYEGSLTIDADLLKASGIRKYQQIQVYNIANGARFTTYAIVGEPGTGIIQVNGAAAHLASTGDLIIIAAYCQVSDEDADDWHPNLVYVDAQNRITHTDPPHLKESGVPSKELVYLS